MEINQLSLLDRTARRQDHSDRVRISTTLRLHLQKGLEQALKLSKIKFRLHLHLLVFTVGQKDIGKVQHGA